MLYLTFPLFVTVGKKIATVAVARVTMKLALMPPSFLLLPLFFLLSSEKSSAVAELCRTRGIFLEPEEFAAETCAFCYHYVPMPKFKTVAHKWIIAPKNITQIKQGAKLTNGTHQVLFNRNSTLLVYFFKLIFSKKLLHCPRLYILGNAWLT